MAVAVAMAAVLVPLSADAILPAPGDLAVGWSFLAASLLASRRRWVASCLGAAGLLWIAIGLAPLGPAAVETPLTRLALVPTALLACASASLSAGRHRRSGLLAAASALGMAALGGAGSPRFALLGIGVAALIVPIRGLARPTATAGLQAAVGGGLVILGLDAAAVATLPVEMSTAVHLLVLACAAVAVGWWAAAGVRLGLGLTPDGPLELGRALGRALGTGEVTVAFPGDDGSWLDPAGRPSGPDLPSYEVLDPAGRVLARTRPALTVETGLVADLQRFLKAAGDGARLRAAMRGRAEELARSRMRLVSVAEDERRRLVSRLEVGPLRRLDHLAAHLGYAVGERWAERTALARRTLDQLVEGLDPVDTDGGLVPALTRLTDATGASLRVRGTVADIDATTARTLWFACAEALANARKHAPGSAVSVVLDTRDDPVLTVDDDGPGGADIGGVGLAGLAERVALVDGQLTVSSGRDGTTVSVRIRPSDDVVPLMSSPSRLASLEP